MHGVHTEARREINANLRTNLSPVCTGGGTQHLSCRWVEASTELALPQTFRRRRLGCGGDHRAPRATQHQEPPSMSRHRPKGSPLPKAPFAAGVAVMGGMFYTVMHDAKRQPGTLDTQTAQQGGATTLSVDADASSSVPSSSVPAKAQPKTAAQFLGGYEEVCQPPRRRGARAASPPRGAHTVARWPPIPGGVHAVYMQHRARCTVGCTCTPRVHCTYTACTLPGVGGERATVCARFDQPGQRAEAAGPLRPAAHTSARTLPSPG